MGRLLVALIALLLLAAGTAADVYVDDKPDGRMDDLDRDGVVTRDDAIWLFKLVDGMDRRPAGPFRGGLGGSNRAG